MPTSHAPEPSGPSGAAVGSGSAKSEAIRASVLVLLVLGGVKHLAPVLGSWAAYAFTFAVGFQLYYPMWRESRTALTRDDLGLNLKNWNKDLRHVLLWVVIVTVPFALGHHVWQIGAGRQFALRFDPGVFNSFVTQTIVIAIAEEIYFRGYLQGRLTAWLGRGRSLFGVDQAIVWASVVFALAHFVGEYNPARLGPFFPALVFGLLRRRSGGVLGAIVFHAYCNLLGDMLFMFYRG